MKAEKNPLTFHLHMFYFVYAFGNFCGGLTFSPLLAASTPAYTKPLVDPPQKFLNFMGSDLSLLSSRSRW